MNSKNKILICLYLLGAPSLCTQIGAQTGQATAQINMENQSKSTFDEEVSIAYGKVKKRDMVGSVASVRPEDRIVYDNTQWVKDYVSDLLLGVKGTSNIRGLGDNALFVIDGVPGRNVDLMSMSEVEEITVLKDLAGVALYGSQGRNGVILITTKKGKANKKSIAFNVNFGVNQIITKPKYMGAAEYMETYNEACTNDGLSPYYDVDLINNTRDGVNPYKYPDTDLLGSDYISDYAMFTNADAEFTGGNDDVQYYVDLSYKYDGNNTKLKKDINQGKNSFRLRANVDFRVNKVVKSSVNIAAYLDNQKQAQANLWWANTSFLPNSYAPLLPVSLIADSYQDQLSNIKTYGGYILGGSNQYKGNTPIADIYAKGYNKYQTKTVEVGNTIQFDLSGITEGLSAQTYLSLDYFDTSRTSVTNDFNYYEPTWGLDEEGNDVITGLTALGAPDKKDLTEHINTTGYQIRYGFSGQVDYKRQFADKHHVAATLMGYGSSIQKRDVKQLDVYGTLGLRLMYDYQNKYYINVTGTQTYSTKLPINTRRGFSPSVGLAYVLSNEAFMKDISWLDFLKCRMSYGELKTDLNINNYFLYDDVYNINTYGYSWNDGTKSGAISTSMRGSNPDLGYEVRKEFTAGFDAQLFQSLYLEASYFRNDMTNQITRLTNSTYPSFYGPFIPYDNYNENRYTGFELGATYSTKLNKLNLSVGANVMYTDNEALKRDEKNEYSYQNRVGRPVHTIYGLEADKLYTASDFDIDGNLLESLPKPQYGTVQPGDVKYVDHNGDNVIDDNDMHRIGRYDNPLSYSCNLKLNYKGFTFFVLANGETGGKQMLWNNYYRPNGTDKYSVFARDRWTVDHPNTNARCPRLTTGDGTNNFKTSTYWMYDNSYFKINRMQLTYDFYKGWIQKVGLKNLSLDIAGSNLIQFAKNKDYRQLNIGYTPQKRYYTLGLRMTL